MNGEKPRYWFPAKRYGWGWGAPATWQGWVVLLVWLAMMLILGPWIVQQSRPLFYAFLSLMVGTLITICWATGEPPKWRWGKKV